MVPGISEHEAEEEGPSYNTRGEDVNTLRQEISSKCDEDTATRDYELRSPALIGSALSQGLG